MDLPVIVFVLGAAELMWLLLTAQTPICRLAIVMAVLHCTRFGS